MNRKLSIVLIVLLCVLITACSADDDHQVVTVLLEETAASWEANFEKVLDYANPNQDISFKFEYLSSDYAKRQTQLIHYRTEIISGEGPDLFILPTWDTEFAYTNSGERMERREPLFTDMYDAMHNGTFLPLDEMITNSKHLNLDNHNSVVMEAGKNEEGQVVLPLLYSYELILLDKAKMEDPEVSFDDLYSFLACEDENMLGTVLGGSFRWIHNVFPNYVDYDASEMGIESHEMYDVLRKVGDAYLGSGDEMIFYSDYLAHPLSNETLYEMNAADDTAFPFVVPNIDEGITAQITVFIAINRNTDCPQEIFNFVEWFFDDEMQRNDKVMIDNGQSYIKVCLDPLLLGAQSGIKTGKINYDQDTYFRSYDEIQEINSKITCARFTTEIDAMLCELWFDSFGEFRNKPVESTDFASKFEKFYSDCQMMAAE